MFNREPTVIINGLSELLRQILPLLVVVGLVQLSPEKLAGLVSITGLVLAFISTTLLRSQTVAAVVADKQIEIAKAADVNTPTSIIIERAKESV